MSNGELKFVIWAAIVLLGLQGAVNGIKLNRLEKKLDRALEKPTIAVFPSSQPEGIDDYTLGFDQGYKTGRENPHFELYEVDGKRFILNEGIRYDLVQDTKGRWIPSKVSKTQ